MRNQSTPLAIRTTQEDSGDVIATVGGASFTTKRGSVQPGNSQRSPLAIESDSRFMTPQRARSINPASDPLRYLTCQKDNGKESIKEILESSRKLLTLNLVNKDRKETLDSARSESEKKELELNSARQAFQDDM